MKTQNGFSLIELAIVLVIVTILIGGLAVPLSAQIQARRIGETNRTLEEAREALIGYAMSHPINYSCTCVYDPSGTAVIPPTTCAFCSLPNPNASSTTTSKTSQRYHLPCPDTDGDGVENRLPPPSTECLQSRGYFPWRDLGTGSQDAWGNRILYSAPQDLTDSAQGFHNGSVSGGNWNQVLSSTAQCSLTPPNVDVAADVPVVLVSHGPNSRGARNVSIPVADPTPTAPTATGANELQNLGTPQNTCTTSFFISTNPSDSFDDLVVWLPFGVLISRVCPSPGGCP